MSTQATIHTYKIIVEKLLRKTYPSASEIHELLLDEGYKIAERSLQRRFEQIRHEFGIKIEYNKTRKGYEIVDEDDNSLSSFIRFLEIINNANLLVDTLKDSKEALKYIHFEARGNLAGIDQLKDILRSIRTKRIIRFTYFSFYYNTKKKHSIKPLLLKEFRNRWYVIGWDNTTKGIRTFGIDRISELEVLTESFVSIKDVKPEELLNDVIGLNYSTDKVQDVIFGCNAIQAKYFISLPLHPSQTIIKENSKEVVFKIKIKPNFELMQQLMQYGDDITLLEPKNLVKDLIGNYNRAIKQLTTGKIKKLPE